MPKIKKQRKTPITKPSTSTLKLGRSHKSTQATIARFHTLLKQQAQLKRQLSSKVGTSDAEEKLREVEREMEELGGLEAYQEASILGQDEGRGGDTSKVLVKWLTELDLKPKDKGKYRMLEIGALSPNNHAASQPWIDNEPIDLNSQHPEIKQQDFLQREAPTRMEDKFDIVSCSLVLNFVPDPGARGKMLSLIHSDLLPSSLLFLVLPRPCLHNSRYLTTSHLTRIMRHIGFEEITSKDKEGAKVVYSLWRSCKPRRDGEAGELGVKRVINEGKKRNNFAVLLQE